MTSVSIFSARRRLAALAWACILFAGCSKVSTDGGGATNTGTAGSTGAAGPNSFTRPHELRVAQLGDVSGLNPLLTTELTAAWPDQLVLAYLFRYDHRNQLTPELATVVPTQANGGISADGKTITYHLRTGVKWSDGKPFTADDVIFSTNIVNDPKTNVQSRQGWEDVVKMDAPDPHTVVYHLSKVFSPFVGQTFTSGANGPAIMPKHLLAHTANINTDPYNSLPVGIGPFKFVEWARADHIALVANPLYWRGQPKLKKIVFKIIPNRDTILAELQTGDVDMWPLLARAYFPRMQSVKGFRVLRQPSYGFGHLDFNNSHAVLSDPIVRRALLLAWDRRTALQKIGHGIGILQDSVVSPSDEFYDPKIGFTEMNVAKANAILDADGWKRASDGVRAKNGIRLTLELVTNVGSPDTDNLIELLRSDWKAIGASILRKNYDPNLLFASAQTGGIIQSGKFDVAIFAWYPSATNDVSNIYACAQAPPAGQNDLRWCNKRADAAMADFLVTFDKARQRRDQFILQEEMLKDTPQITQSIYEDLFALNTDLTGFHPNNVSFFDDFMNVDI
jgi:peptide/nickel transport system substrate-binding protein